MKRDRAWFMMRRTGWRIGRRGAFLLFAALLASTLAASTTIMPPDVRASPGYLYLSGFLPLWLWSALWVCTALVCVLQAFRSSDRVAYAVSSSMIILWGLLYIVSSLSGHNPRGWVAGLIFIAFGGLVTLIATWPEALNLRTAVKPIVLNPDAIVTADQNGLIRSWNKAAMRMFGWTADEMVGRPITAMMPERFHAAHEAGLSRARRLGRVQRAGQMLELIGLHADGTEFPIELMISVVEVPSGTLLYSGLIRRTAVP